MTAFEDQSQLKGAHWQERVGDAALWVLSLITVLPILGIVIYIIYKGAPGITWEFLTSMPTNGMREGGIFPAILGTLLLTLGCFLFAVPLGIAAGIYIAEYAKDTAADPRDPHRHHQPGRCTFCGLRPVRSGTVRGLLQDGGEHPGSLADPGDHDPAGDHQHHRRSPAQRAECLPGGEHLAGCHALADHLADHSAGSACPAF